MIYVSNHGGRQLDHGRGAMEVLPEIVDAIGGRAPVIIDGGFNRGTDIVKALAAGASLVGLGRMQCIGLAAGGQAGLVRLLESLEQENHICLGLLGVAAWAGLDRSYLHAAPAVGAGDTLGAFPLLNLEEQSFY
jgi:glycolate oxidase